MKEPKIKYVVHPVTADQKQEIRNQGFKIVDARFAPKGEEVYNPNEKKKPARGSASKE